MLFLLVACSDISGQWRDYSFNKAEIPAEICKKKNCHRIYAFSLELDETSYTGDFRLEIEEDDEHYIYTLPAEALLIEKSSWTVFLDNSDYPDMAERWDCDVRGRILDCAFGEELIQFRRGKHP